MTTLAVKLTEAHEQFLREAVERGSFTSKSEVIATALDMLRAREAAKLKKRAELRNEIEKGISDLDAGRVATFSLDSFLAEMKARRVAQA